MNDASGMLEPLGIALCLTGIWAWTRRKGFGSGLAFGLASMARAEAWIFGLGMVVAAQLARDRLRSRGPIVFGFALVVGVYMAVLLQKTGNPIYPLWWNFLANAVGRWEVPATAYQSEMRPVLGALLAVALVGLAWALFKRPRSYMLLTFGFGNWVFVTGLMGFTSYLADWSWWTPIGRHFEFPYMFAATLAVVGLVWWLPRKVGPRAVPAGWAAVVVLILVAQLAWIPIANAFGPTEVTWRAAVTDGRSLATLYDRAPYAGHALAVPPDRPDITYVLARFGGVEGKHLISEMYAPAHPDACWFAKLDVRLIAVDPAHQSLLEGNASWFTRIGTLDGAKWDVYAVNAPPCPSAA